MIRAAPSRRVPGAVARRVTAAAAPLAFVAALVPYALLGLSACAGGEPVRAQVPESSPCALVQKPRVYIGLTEDVDLDRYEAAAAVALPLLRVIRSGVCSRLASARRPLLPVSLRRQLGRGRRVLIESVQFTGASLQRADVLLRDEAQPERAWLVQLRSERSWNIECVREDPAATFH